MLRLEILEQGRVVYDTAVDSPVELGRRDVGRQEPPPFFLTRVDGRQRLVVVDADRTLVSRRHVTLEQLAGNRLSIRNETVSSLLLCGYEADLQPLEPQTSLQTSLPATVVFPDDLRVHVRAEETALQGLRNVTRAPGSAPTPVLQPMQRTMGPADIVAGEGFLAESLLVMMQRLADGYQLQTEMQAAQSYAVRQLVELLGAAGGRILVPTGEHKVLASWSRETGFPPLRDEVVQHVAASKRTLWKRIPPGSGDRVEFSGLVVAAPVLAADGELRSILYADLDSGGPRESAANDRATAQLVELTATGLASALVRIEQQQDVRNRKQRFEQFFGTQLAVELERCPDLLNGRDAEVSILFCDLRGFSRISEALGTVGTFEWIQSVMTALTQCVTEEEGVLLDYIGDELIAMWGAPAPIDDHALRAVRAGQRMLERLPELNAQWRDRLGTPFSLGVGVNTGPVRVGNIGSEQKFKYGPLGNTVNLASRIQSLNKQFGTRMLISESTWNELAPAPQSRRLGSFRVVGIEQPIQLFEISELSTTTEWRQLQRAYQTALEHFERCEFTTVLELLSVALRAAVSDRPSLLLLSRAATALSSGPAAEHPVWTVTEK